MKKTYPTDCSGQLNSLAEGEVLYVPSIVKKEIQYPAIGKGELFTIITAEKKSGTLRRVKRLITANDTRVPVGAPANKNATSQKRTGSAAGA